MLDRCPAAAPVDVPCREATGLVLAAAVVAAEDVPPFANSAVDGYAVVAASVATVPVDLPVVGEVAAGAYTDRVLQSGEAIRIMTGAPVPAGADAVVMVEDTELLGDRSVDGSVVRAYPASHHRWCCGAQGRRRRACGYCAVPGGHLRHAGSRGRAWPA